MTRLYYIYIAATLQGGFIHGPCAVGVSANPKRRVMWLQVGNPAEIVLYRMFPFRSKEAAIYEADMAHAAHQDCRLVGNWFAVDPASLADFIETRKQTGREICVERNGWSA